MRLALTVLQIEPRRVSKSEWQHIVANLAGLAVDPAGAQRLADGVACVIPPVAQRRRPLHR